MFIDRPQPPMPKTSIIRYHREDAVRTGDVDQYTTLVVTYDANGYARVHEDILGPLLRAANYEIGGRA